MQNPFEEIVQELQSIKAALSELKTSDTQTPIEIIDRKELMKRLRITEPTVIIWGRKGKIPELRIGANVRYNWPAVVKALENTK